jgi:hypothetical protein
VDYIPHKCLSQKVPPHKAVTKETLEDKKEEVKEMILDGEDMYLRSMTIMMDAGARYFCWSLEMEPNHIFNLNYKVELRILFN